MSRTNHADIRIGTLAGMNLGADYLRQILPHGFESFELTCWEHIGAVNLGEYAKECSDVIGEKAVISGIGVYGNPLQDEQTAADWKTLIESAGTFGAKVVCGFAGALEDRPVDESMTRFAEVFGPLAKLAEDHNVKIAFENCDMGGTWDRPRYNIAHSPRAWEMMFNSVDSDAIGLEWEPCHQMVSLVDPIRNLRKYVSRVYHVHGKDATINRDIIEDAGLRSGLPTVFHRTPGFGDTNWADVITILRLNGFEGAIDIEGWHDPVYRDDLEMTGQVYAMNYLKQCRGGTYIANPVER